MSKWKKTKKKKGKQREGINSSQYNNDNNTLKKMQRWGVWVSLFDEFCTCRSK